MKDIGYTRAKYGFDGETVAVLVAIDEQSPDIAQGVDAALEVRDQDEKDDIGAGDQGLMFGFAVDETPELMPLPIALSHRLVRRLAELRKEKVLPYLRPDAKSQVTVEYDDQGQPQRVDTIVISTQHDDETTLEQIEKDIKEQVINEVIPHELLDDETKYFINPTGRFVIGGPQGDAGLTGRKIIVDTYGGYARHGGGAFLEKMQPKLTALLVMLRVISRKTLLLLVWRKVEVQLAYAIGVAQPVSISINTFGTSDLPESKLIEAVRKNFDLRPAGIIEMLDLRRPIYKQTAAYGHFGRTDIDLPWEQTDKVEALKASLAE